MVQPLFAFRPRWRHYCEKEGPRRWDLHKTGPVSSSVNIGFAWRCVSFYIKGETHSRTAFQTRRSLHFVVANAISALLSSYDIIKCERRPVTKKNIWRIVRKLWHSFLPRCGNIFFSTKEREPLITWSSFSDLLRKVSVRLRLSCEKYPQKKKQNKTKILIRRKKKLFYVIKIIARHASCTGTVLLSQHYFDHNFRGEFACNEFSCAL